MSWDPPTAPLSIPPAQINAENNFHHCVGPEHPPSHLPLQSQSDNAGNHSLPSTSRKRKRTTSLDSAAVGGYGPISTSPGEQTEPSTPDLSPVIKFAERKNSAYDIWPFTRAVETDEIIPADHWPDDYGDFLTKRPDATFVGCKLCTEFG